MHNIDTMLDLMTRAVPGNHVICQNDEEKIQLRFLIETRLMNRAGADSDAARLSIHGAWLLHDENEKEKEVIRERLRSYYERYALSASIQYAMDAVRGPPEQ